MKIELHEITVREIFNGYTNDDEEGSLGFGGKLNIRPKYQREFVYKETQRNAVIESIQKSYPLNVMYWVKNEDNTFELLDGQQRTVSICKYVGKDYSINGLAFHNLPSDKQKQILDYKLMIYFCEGTDSEKLEWFRIINIAGEKLTEQELRNAIYTGEWLTNAKKHFSKTQCVAYGLGSNYLTGSPIRQEYLETVIKWISENKIEDYMSKHQHDKDASELWQYFQSVISWVERLFTNYRKEMKGIDWGILYNKYNSKKYNANDLEKEIASLMQDDDVTKKSGIYEYVLDNKNVRSLSIRAFSDNQKREAYEKQNSVCLTCKKEFDIKEMEADHITPWSKGGKTIADNCQMLCKNCNRVKSGK